MKGDFTRLTFQPKKHYTTVRMQQGRLQLDADWNEQVDIQTYLQQQQARNIIGVAGVPKPESTDGNGFEIHITPNNSGTNDSQKQNLEISAGNIYVDGILCELETSTLFTQQSDYPEAVLPDKPDKDGVYVAYLDVWERHITALDDIEIREVALTSVPDTTTRTKTIQQVKLEKIGEISEYSQIQSDLANRWKNWWESAIGQPGKMSAKILPANSDSTQGSRQLENRLYRVEIHESGTLETATFKWSNNNGIIVSRVQKISGDTITILDLGKDDSQTFYQKDKTENWIELTSEANELKGEPGVFLRLTEKTMGTKLVFDPTTAKGNLQVYQNQVNLKVRRWEQVPKNTGANWLELGNEGIQIQFDSSNSLKYHVGDYWLIPSREVTNDIEWPIKENQPESLPPQGIDHHYSLLALLKFENGKFDDKIDDYRPKFIPLTFCLDKRGDTMTLH